MVPSIIKYQCANWSTSWVRAEGSFLFWWWRYSSQGKQHDFFDADSDSESDTESGDVLKSIIDEIEEGFDNIIELRGRFRGSLDEMKDADMDKKKKILKKVAALIVKIFECEEEGVKLNDNNPFSFIEEIKLVMDEQDNQILDKAMERAITKRIEEKQG